MICHVSMSASDDCLLESEVRTSELAPQIGFELATHNLTAERAPERTNRQSGGLTPGNSRCFAARIRTGVAGSFTKQCTNFSGQTTCGRTGADYRLGRTSQTKAAGY